MKLPALTIKQPWASLMITVDSKHPRRAYKPLEGRTWDTAYRGPILIHTGKQTETEALRTVQEKGQAFPQSYPKSAIIGMAELTACRRPTVTNSVSLVEECEALFGRVYDVRGSKEPLPAWLLEGQIWLWEFHNPVKFKESIPCKGKLRLWTPEAGLHPEIERQISLAMRRDAL